MSRRALTTNSFTRPGFTFAGWNTAANGSGAAYADGASYPFTADATMFAQWTAIPTKTVTFDSNGGAGSIADEVDNVPTALTSNSFTRAGFTFAGWTRLPTAAAPATRTRQPTRSQRTRPCTPSGRRSRPRR